MGASETFFVLFVYLGLLVVGALSIDSAITVYNDKKYFRFGLWAMTTANILVVQIGLFVYMVWFME